MKKTVLGESNAGAAAAPGAAGKTVEQTYQKKTQLEHILLRPDSYIGSTQKLTQPMWVLDAAAVKIVHRPISFVPGLFKIFDEILVNAADNKQRDKAMDGLRVRIDPAANAISVWNNGAQWQEKRRRLRWQGVCVYVKRRARGSLWAPLISRHHVGREVLGGISPTLSSSCVDDDGYHSLC